MRFICLSLIILFSNTLFGQDGLIDTTFNEALYDHFGNAEGPKTQDPAIYAMAFNTTDDKIYVAGDFITYNSRQVKGIARLNADGSFDKSFNTIGAGWTAANIRSIAVQSDGKVIIGGDVSVGGIAQFFVRLNPDGSLDNSFILQVGDIDIHFIKIDANDKIIYALPTGYVGRLNADGSLDPTFSEQYFPDDITGLEIQSDGKIIVSGLFDGYLKRLNTDGSPDATFNIGADINDEIYSIDVADDKIVINGRFTQLGAVSCHGLARLNADGTPDAAFSTAGTWNMNTSRGIVCIQPDQKIMLSTDCSSYDENSIFSGLLRINQDGSFDRTIEFGAQMGSSYYVVQADAENRVLLGGEMQSMFGYGRNCLLRLDTDLSLDKTFNSRPGFSGEMSTYNSRILVDNYSNYLVSGDFFTYNDTLVGRLARIKADGSLDAEFNYSGGAGDVSAFALQADNKILVSVYNSLTSAYTISRLMPGGEADPSFTPSVFNSPVHKICIRPDGKIMAYGAFSQCNSQPCGRAARIHADGTIDTLFQWLDAYQVWDAVETASGKTLIIGNFLEVNGVPAKSIASLNSDGSLDGSFNTTQQGFFQSGITAIALQSDGKIIVQGTYSFNGDSYGPLIRLNANGSFDNTFTQLNNLLVVGSLQVQGDDKIIIEGYYDYYGEAKLIRLFPDGTQDLSFNSYTGVDENPAQNGNIYSMVFTPDGKLALIGDFTTFQNKPANRIAVIEAGAPASSGLNFYFDSIQNISCNEPGFVHVQPTGGTFPYSYYWPGLPDPFSASQLITERGVYTCTVTDAFGLTKTASLLIDAPDNPDGMDLKANLVASEFRTGFSSYVFIDALNDGCIPAVTGTVRLITSDLIAYQNADPLPSQVNGDTLIWNFQDLTVESSHLTPRVYFQTSVEAEIGDSVYISLSITPEEGDIDSSNNFRNYAFPIVNGYDPNIKSAYPLGKCEENYIKKNQTITYTVKFQNTGNSEAINIAVVDSLPPGVDLNSLHIVGSSDSLWIEKIAGNTVKFHFDEIHLPDSAANPQASIGYIIFEVDLLGEELTHNSLIENKAQIYFDFNEAIITNTVRHSIFDLYDLDLYNCFGNIGLKALENEKIDVFPNPSTGHFLIKAGEEIGSIRIIDMLGKVVYESGEAFLEKEFDLDTLQPGIYYIHFLQSGQKLNSKIVITAY